MVLVALIISCIANLCSCYAVYTNFKNIKMLRQAIKERDELIASQQALMDGQLAENEKKIKHLQELQEEKEQECLTSYDNSQEFEPDVRAFVREFVEKAPVINKYSDEKDDDRARKILQQLMMDEQRKNEAIEIIEDFNRWFMAKQSVTVAEANKWDRAQYLSFLLMKPKPLTWAELAEKSPEEQQRYSSCWKTVIY
ncbi:hypothetical protein [Bartonella saheliensis]|uniref:hypothetical protein n=1 Tax=Bartonella saheliensis TaxID=1457016 RepID=UPI00119DF815|nr:hypothetical protein [Bartonella saheliensis]